KLMNSPALRSDGKSIRPLMTRSVAVSDAGEEFAAGIMQHIGTLADGVGVLVLTLVGEVHRFQAESEIVVPFVAGREIQVEGRRIEQLVVQAARVDADDIFAAERPRDARLEDAIVIIEGG